MESNCIDVPQLVNLRRYISAWHYPDNYPLKPVKDSAPILRKYSHKRPENAFSSFPLDQSTAEHYQEEGVAAITWDEGIGRVCIAAENEMCIQILDFAHVVQPDERFARWKRNQDMVLHDVHPHDFCNAMAVDS